jgi:glutamate formiminotransferase / 5-formyltetrahydrofolate cyclo-ligase
VLLAVPNFSEGRDPDAIGAIHTAFAGGDATALDLHSDPVHNRSVVTLAGPAGVLSDALVRGARACIERIDMRGHRGEHPCVGALDVCPVVWLTEGDREPARADALAAARAIGSGGVPVIFYGDLASAPERRERAFLRAGGLPELSRRIDAGELRPDVGPPEPHPSAGVTLVTARPPLAAFNVVLDTGDVGVARAVAARLREAGGGPVGVRAIAVDLAGRAQVSTNVHDPIAVPLARVADLVAALAGEHDVRPAAAEIVGLVPEASLEGFPRELEIEGFDPERQVIERRITAEAA